MTLITGMADVVISLIKAALFGLAAGLIACYKGISVGGGPAGVGNAVNETVVFTFMALFAINIIVTAVGIQVTIRERRAVHAPAASSALRRAVRVGRGVEPDRLSRPSSMPRPWRRLAMRSCTTRREMLRLIAQMGLGTGALAVIGGTVVIVGVPDDDRPAPGGGAGLQPVRIRGCRSPDRVRVGVLQRPADRAGDRRRSRWRRPSAPAPPLRWARCGSTRRSTRSR